MSTLDDAVQETNVTQNVTQGAAATTKKPQAKKKYPSAIPDVIARYKAAEWEVVRVNTGLIASKGEGARRKTHFVSVFESYTNIKDQSDKSVEENNAYIQNAFSNQAIPVYVFANYNAKKDVFDKLTFKDINTGKSLRIIS